MGSTPQTSDGYTRTANELMEAECKACLTGNEWRVYNAVKRLTYGWNKKEARIAYSRIVDLTGLAKNRVYEAVQSLIKKSVLLSRPTGTHSPQILGINKNFSKWQVSRSGGISRPTGTPYPSSPVQKCTAQGGPLKKERQVKEKTSPSGDEDCYFTSKKKKLKGKRLKTFLIFWDAFAYKNSKAEAAQAWLDIPKLTDSLCAQIYEAARREASNRSAGRTPKMAQGWLSGRRWEDEEMSDEHHGGQHGSMPDM